MICRKSNHYKWFIATETPVKGEDNIHLIEAKSPFSLSDGHRYSTKLNQNAALPLFHCNKGESFIPFHSLFLLQSARIAIKILDHNYH